MYYHEEKMNLMDVPQGWWIAHCISGDFALGAGVAKQITEAFNMRAALRSMWGEDSAMSGQWSVPCCLPVGNVFNLVTKERYFHKPTLDSLRTALEEMARYAENMRVAKIAMPKIGCGLDKLSWDDVAPMIRDIFEDTDIEIMVCCL